MSERWHIVDVIDGRLLEVCYSIRKARREQKHWNDLRVFHGGPRTTIRRVAIRDEDE